MVLEQAQKKCDVTVCKADFSLKAADEVWYFYRIGMPWEVMEWKY